MELGCIGKSNTNNLPAPTDLTENPYMIKTFFQKLQVKNRPPWYHAELVAIKMVPRSPIFIKCPHLREKGGVLTQIGAYSEYM
jgi:hypothetical protein